MRRIIYPGTFDPIHNGHIDIAARASKLFDELIFVVAVNADKNPLLTAEERVQLILDSTSILANVAAIGNPHPSALAEVRMSGVTP